ncbi:MAG: hypothetical protein PX640_12025, partial [Microcystis sp. M49629_WE12]|nr:hypothetical protein [Microcystis sp. M49629_WE12]
SGHYFGVKAYCPFYQAGRNRIPKTHPWLILLFLPTSITPSPLRRRSCGNLFKWLEARYINGLN